MRRLRMNQQQTRSVRRPAIAAVAMLMVLLTASALAVGLKVSRQVEVKRIAREAVMQQYGLDGKALGMFSEHAEEKNGVWEVRYGTWKPEQAGEYLVTIHPDGTAEASWTLEDVEGAWGQAEIAAYIQRKDAAVQKQIEAERLAGVATAEPRPTPVPVQGAKLSHEQAIEKANEAMKATFGFGNAGLNEFDAECDWANGVWMVSYSAGGWHWKDGRLAVKAGRYAVEIDDASGDCLSAVWSLEGRDSGAYTRETFGKALAYDARCMEWVAEIRTQFEAAYTAVETSRWPVSVEEMARLDGLMIAAGFDAAKYNHVLPGKDDLSLEEALALTAQILESEYGVSREAFEQSSFAYTDLTQEKTHRQWYFWVQNHELQMGWQVTMNAETGEILDMIQESFAAGNG